MKHLKTLIILSLSLSTAGVFASDEEVKFSGEAGYMNRYIWRGIQRSDQSNYTASLNWERGDWSGGFWGTYDNSTGKYITDFDSNWMEFDTTVAYTISEGEQDSWTAGYKYYAFHDDFHDSQEVFLNYRHKSFWNPEFSVYYDFDFNDGIYVSTLVSHSKKDREWEYAMGLKLGYFSSFGNRFTDQKLVNNVVRTNPMSNQPAMSGLADLVPAITLTRHMDDESSYSLKLGGNIILEDDTYNGTAKDDFAWGVSYNLQF
jgi:hypothetical protein